jgi:flagellar hook-associated protein 2
VITNSDGTSSLSLLSNTAGYAGTLTVTSNILDSTDTTTKTLNYNHSSDLSGLANLGITVSPKADGSLTFDAASLDSILNQDFSGAVGFFQNTNSWGRTFAGMLDDAGSSSSSGSLSLAKKAISSSESTLNASISKEESLISAQEKSLTTQLNKANQILQQLPSQLDGINQIYSAISGYKTNN